MQLIIDVAEYINNLLRQSNLSIDPSLLHLAPMIYDLY